MAKNPMSPCQSLGERAKSRKMLPTPLPAEHDHETSSHDPFNMDPTTLEQLFSGWTD